jgi:hypothetical protein
VRALVCSSAVWAWPCCVQLCGGDERSSAVVFRCVLSARDENFVSNAASARAARPRRAGSGTIEAVARRTPIALVVVDDGTGLPAGLLRAGIRALHSRGHCARGRRRGARAFDRARNRRGPRRHGGGAQLTVWRGRRLDLAPGGRRRRCRCFGPRLGGARIATTSGPAHGLLDLFGEAWKQTISSRSLPTFLKMCGVFGPTIAMSPGKPRCLLL